VAKVEHHVGELFPRRLHRDESPAPQSRSRAVLQQARHRRTVDRRKETGGALDATVVSSVPGENEVRLQLSALAYNFGNLWRRLVLSVRGWKVFGRADFEGEKKRDEIISR
jgi:hypothetical protein